MIAYKRTHSKKVVGTHYVFENLEEANKNGITDVKISAKFLNEGDWFQYGDGRIAQILRVSKVNDKYRDSVYYYTVLNTFTRSHGFKHSHFSPLYSLVPDEIDLESVDSTKMDFLEDWLFKGVPLEDCVVKYFSNWLPLFVSEKGYMVHWSLTEKKKKRFFYKSLGYYILSGIWFETVLKDNRLIRERYMGLINAFEKAGMDDAYAAQKIKEHIEDENPKKSVPALNMLLDILREFEKRKGNVNAYEISEVIEEAKEIADKQLQQHEVPLNIPANLGSQKELNKELNEVLTQIEEEHDKLKEVGQTNTNEVPS